MDTVFLDRDGVINKKIENGYVLNWYSFEFLPNVFEGLKRLNEENFRLIILTNQACIGKGILSEEKFHEIMYKMINKIRKKGGNIHKYYVCPDYDNSSICRKPNVGLFLKAKIDFPDINFKNSFVIGDSISDIKAGKEIGSRTILIHSNTNFTMEITPDFFARDLLDAAEIIIKHKIKI